MGTLATIRSAGRRRPVLLAGGAGGDLLVGGSGEDVLAGGPGTPTILALLGSNQWKE